MALGKLKPLLIYLSGKQDERYLSLLFFYKVYNYLHQIQRPL